jgi:serine protease Do
MRRAVVVCSLAVLVVGSPFRAAAQMGDLQEALPFQETLQKAVAAAEPSVACILVSRSDAYQRLGQGPAPMLSQAIFDLGRLGAFDPGGNADLKKLDLADPNYIPESFGSGVVIDTKGLVLTNYHVVRDATKIYVRLPGKLGSYADIHAADRRSDLAVLRLLNDRLPLQAIKIGDGGALRKGQLVLTIANPFAAGFRDASPTASWGMVSNVREKFPKALDSPKADANKETLHIFGTLALIDNRLNLGCSGGAVIDLRGELAGLTTTVWPGGGAAGGCICVPLDAALKRIIDRLRDGLEVEYGFLGVYPEPQPREGVRLNTVTPGSPAALSGLRVDDTLLSINGVAMQDRFDLFLHVGACLCGSEIRLEVRAPGNQVRAVTATLAKFYVPGRIIAANPPPAIRGLRVDHASILAQVRQRSLAQVHEGVMVREVQENSGAESALVKVHELITHVNGRRVSTPADFYREAEKIKGTLELTILEPPRVVKIN